MSKIILNNGTELETISNNGFSKVYQNIGRSCIEFVFDSKLYKMDYLNSLFSNETNTKKITILDFADNKIANTFIHDDYTIKISISAYQHEVVPETVEDPAVFAEYISVKMAQLTYAEKQQLGLQTQIDTILVSMVKGGVV